MKKSYNLLIIIFLIPFFGLTQNDSLSLKFDTKYYDAVDKWIAFPKTEKDSTHILGFIYLDQSAGFTLRVGNSFKIEENKLVSVVIPEMETTMIIHRLATNTIPVAVLSPQQLEQLNLPKIPDWLDNYYSDKGSVQYLTKTGYHFNHIGASHNAIAPLLKAYEKDPSFDGLVFELGFAYNATKQYNKAIPILKKEITTSKDQLLYKELGYAYMNLKDVVNTEKVYKEGIKYAKDKNYKAEMAINMCALLLNIKDKKKLEKWLNISRKYIDEKSSYKQYLEYFENENEKLK